MKNKNQVKVKYLATTNGNFLINHLFTFGYISQDLSTALRLVDSDEWTWAIENWSSPFVDEMWIDKSVLTDLLSVIYKNLDIEEIDEDLTNEDDFYDNVEYFNEDDFYDDMDFYDEEIETKSFGHGFVLGDVSMNDAFSPDTHTFRGNYYIDNGIIYCQFVGHTWHSYPGAIGYQAFGINQICGMQFPENEIPANVRIQEI